MFIFVPVSEHLSSSHFRTISNKNAQNSHTQVSVYGHGLSFVLCKCIGVEWPDYSVGVNFLRNSSVFQGGGTILHPQQQCMKSQLLYLLTNTWHAQPFYFSHSSRCVVVLICIEHLLMCLFIIRITFWLKS